MGARLMKLYVPVFNSNNCAVLQSGEVIRVYETRPTTNSSINYIDYYINSHYIERSGVQQFNQYATIPSCIDSTIITTDFYYRFDLDSILVCFLIITIFCFYFPYRLISRMFGRWLKI